jgi:glutaredoxin
MKKFIYLIIALVVLFGLYKLLSTQPGTQGVDESNADLVLYWGDGCPHCEKVKEYIASTKIDQKVKITLKEVYYNRTNQLDLEAKAKSCPSIDTSQGIGVPFAYVPTTKACLQGDEPIINWLSQK